MKNKQIKSNKRGRPKKEPTKAYFRRVPEESYSEIASKLDAIIHKYSTKKRKRK